MDRYTYGGNGLNRRMVEDTDGQWVRYSDVEALLARVRELEEQVKLAESMMQQYEHRQSLKGTP
jgi:hypothetical protein